MRSISKMRRMISKNMKKKKKKETMSYHILLPLKIMR